MKGPSKREVQEIDELGPYLARIGNPTYISKTEAYLLRDDCLSDFKQVSIDKANRILRMIEKQVAEVDKMQTLLTQVRRNFVPYIGSYQTLFYVISMYFHIIKYKLYIFICSLLIYRNWKRNKY